MYLYMIHMRRVVERTKILQWEEDEIHTRITIEDGKIQDFAVIYYTLINGRPHQVVRYDCAHGYAHKDILYTRAHTKGGLPKVAYKEAFNIALDDIERNWRDYKQKYIRLVQSERKS